VLGLTQCLPLHGTQSLHSFHHSRELVLERKRGHWYGTPAIRIQAPQLIRDYQNGACGEHDVRKAPRAFVSDRPAR